MEVVGLVDVVQLLDFQLFCFVFIHNGDSTESTYLQSTDMELGLVGTKTQNLNATFRLRINEVSVILVKVFRLRLAELSRVGARTENGHI